MSANVREAGRGAPTPSSPLPCGGLRADAVRVRGVGRALIDAVTRVGGGGGRRWGHSDTVSTPGPADVGVGIPAVPAGGVAGGTPSGGRSSTAPLRVGLRDSGGGGGGGGVARVGLLTGGGGAAGALAGGSGGADDVASVAARATDAVRGSTGGGGARLLGTGGLPASAAPVAVVSSGLGRLGNANVGVALGGWGRVPTVVYERCGMAGGVCSGAVSSGSV